MNNINLGIGLIHNNNSERNKILIPNLKLLQENLEKDYRVDYTDISYQPTIKPHSLNIAIRRDYMYWKLNRQWSKYRSIHNKNIILDSMLLLMKIKKKYLKNNLKNRKTSFVETIVTDKHVRAWSILAKKNDYLLIFEDDAVFDESSIEQIRILISNILLQKIDSYVYVDLAGGCSIDSLQINQLKSNRDNKYIYYNKIVTNTACAYGLNKKLALFFLDHLILKPELQYIGIDWMMNALCIELENEIDTTNTFCLHCYPPIVTHGSVSGTFRAWER